MCRGTCHEVPKTVLAMKVTSAMNGKCDWLQCVLLVKHVLFQRCFYELKRMVSDTWLVRMVGPVVSNKVFVDPELV